MTRARRRSAPFVVAVTALALTACGGEAPPQVDSSSATTPASTPTPTSEEVDLPEQQQLTAEDVAAALPTKNEGPYPLDPKGFDAAAQSVRTTDPESCLALYLDTPEMRTFKEEHAVEGEGRVYTLPQRSAAPSLAVALWSHDEAYPKKFFDQAGAAISDCARHGSRVNPDSSDADWQATTIPTPAMGDQSFGVRIGRPQIDMAIDYLWVRSGHNLITVRMRTGYQHTNDKRLSTYAQGVLDDLRTTP
ncbi:hypothetical protein [Janibacter limosus]|uniref:hypothetical protein n=1 Tax=Janibacter limosus TaxID=53458 RepID=UPI00082AFD4E|nr:hypothetical protein [Janibacter limosus]